MKKLTLTFFISLLFLIHLVSAAPSCATYDCSMFLWYPLGFIIVMVYMFCSGINLIARLAQVDVDAKDLILAMSGFIGYLFFRYFCITYFDDAFMLETMENFMWFFGFTHLILPPIALIFTWLKRGRAE